MAEPDRNLDLKGEVCPYTMVRTILELEKMKPGQVLEVTVDHATAAEDVPRSVANRGHSLLEVRQTEGQVWNIRVQKAESE